MAVLQPNPTVRNEAQEKWQGAMRSGYQLVPNILIQAHRELNLDPLDVLILLNINMHWWEASILPYPKPALIADRIGVSRRTVERRLSLMQKAGLIQRLPPEQVRGVFVRKIRLNGLNGLVEQLSKLAEIQPGLRQLSRPAAADLDDERDGIDEEISLDEINLDWETHD